MDGRVDKNIYTFAISEERQHSGMYKMDKRIKSSIKSISLLLDEIKTITVLKLSTTLKKSVDIASEVYAKK